MKKPARKTIVKVYSKNGCNVTSTCIALGVSRWTFYKWRDKDESLDSMLKEAEEALIDFAESKLMEHISNNDTTALIFFLKTKGKKRGYVEKVEQDVNINSFEKLMAELPD